MAKRDDGIRSHDLKPETVRALATMKEEIRQEDFREGLRDAVREALPAILNARPPERVTAPVDRQLGPMERLVTTYDEEEMGLRALARIAKDGVDKPGLIQRITASGDLEGKWAAQWIGEPLGRLSRFETARADLTTALDRERHVLMLHEQRLQELQAKYAEAPVGDPARSRLEVQAKNAIDTREALRAHVSELEGRLAHDVSGLLDQAKTGLGRYLEAVFPLLTGQMTEELEAQARGLSSQAGEVLGALKRYEALLARAETQAGRPLRVPRLTSPVREALESLAKNAYAIVEEV